MSHVEPGNASTIRVGTFNAKFLPLVSRSNTRRARVLAHRLRASQYDVIGLNEVFAERARAVLVEELAPSFPYIVAQIRSRQKRQDSGLMLFSKIPFQRLNIDSEDRDGIVVLHGGQLSTGYVRFHEYSSCLGTDCLAGKGIGYVRIQLRNRPIHVLFTHLQATYLHRPHEHQSRTMVTRADQIEEMTAFIQRVVGPGRAIAENALILGDLNVDGSGLSGRSAWRRYPGSDREWSRMLATLGKAFEGGLRDAWRVTARPSDPGLTYPADNPAARVDYILMSAADKALPMCPVRMQLDSGLIDPVGGPDPKAWLLSDHLGVSLELQFGTPPSLGGPESTIPAARHRAGIAESSLCD